MSPAYRRVNRNLIIAIQSLYLKYDFFTNYICRFCFWKSHIDLNLGDHYFQPQNSKHNVSTLPSWRAIEAKLRSRCCLCLQKRVEQNKQHVVLIKVDFSSEQLAQEVVLILKTQLWWQGGKGSGKVTRVGSEHEERAQLTRRDPPIFCVRDKMAWTHQSSPCNTFQDADLSHPWPFKIKTLTSPPTELL